MNDPVEHATGLEKKELLAIQAGNDNPFDMKVFKRGPGTKENPTLIPSAFDARLVGCICTFIIIIIIIVSHQWVERYADKTASALVTSIIRP